MLLDDRASHNVMDITYCLTVLWLFASKCQLSKTNLKQIHIRVLENGLWTS
jgi:hypothetical protein